MIDQEKSGKYIAEKRKQLGMTQKELAEKVGLTDKAVSKWECGKSIPDNAILDEICKILNISFNEYLSGEDIADIHYSHKAEENMRELIQENQKEKKSNIVVIIGMIISLLIAIVGMYGVMHGSGGQIAAFIDLPSFMILVGGVLLLLTISGNLSYFVNSLQILFRKKVYTEQQLENSIRGLRQLIVLNIMYGLFLTISQYLYFLCGVRDSSYIFAMIPIFILTFWYGLLLDLFWIPCYFKLLSFKN